MALNTNENARQIDRIGPYRIMKRTAYRWGDGNTCETTSSYYVETSAGRKLEFSSLEEARRYCGVRT